MRLPIIFISHGMPSMALDDPPAACAEAFDRWLPAAVTSATRLHTHFEYGVLSLAAYRWD